MPYIQAASSSKESLGKRKKKRGGTQQFLQKCPGHLLKSSLRYSLTTVQECWALFFFLNLCLWDSEADFLGLSFKIKMTSSVLMTEVV